MFTPGKLAAAYDSCLAGAPKPLGSGRYATSARLKAQVGRNHAMLLR
jgi:hypothetical protein